MSVYHRTQRLQVFGDKPEIEKLYGNRYRMVVRCVAANGTKAWYNANKAQIFADFGTLYSAQMSVDGIDARTGEAYPDMVLVENKAYIYGRSEEYLVEFTYETLTDSFVQETEDKVDFDLNGLKRLTRTIIARDTVAYSSVVGTSTTGSSPQLTLAQVSEDQLEASQDGFKRIREVWMESGILSVSQQFIGGSAAIQVQAFNKTSAEVSTALSEVTASHVLISEGESEYEGIKTSSYQYQLDESFTEDYELNGLKRISLIELSSTDFTAQTVGSISTTTPTTGLYLGTQNIDNGGSIKVRESVWIEEGTIRVSSRNLSEGVQEVSTTFLVNEGTTVGPVVSRSTDNFEGLKTITVSTIQDGSGGSIIGDGLTPVHTYERLVDFTYPGIVSVRQDVITSDVGVNPRLLNFELKGPVQAKVQSTVSVFFQSSNAISAADLIYNGGSGSDAVGFWNPTEWANTYVSGIGWNYAAFSVSQSLRGYRASSDVSGITTLTPTGANSFTSNGVTVFTAAGTSYIDTVTNTATPLARINGVADDNGVLFTVDGRRVYAKTPFILQVSGGPEDPVGEKYTLDVDIRPAFEGVDGTQYYKKSIVVSTIPAQ